MGHPKAFTANRNITTKSVRLSRRARVTVPLGGFVGSQILKLEDFGFGQGAEFAGRNVEGDGAKLNALDFFHQEANFEKHAANLAIATLDKNDFVPGIFHVLIKADFGGRGFYTAAIFEGIEMPSRNFWMAFSLGLPLTFTRYVFGMCEPALVSFWASAPSLVMISRPSLA